MEEYNFEKRVSRYIQLGLSYPKNTYFGSLPIHTSSAAKALQFYFSASRKFLIQLGPFDWGDEFLHG